MFHSALAKNVKLMCMESATNESRGNYNYSALLTLKSVRDQNKSFIQRYRKKCYSCTRDTSQALAHGNITNEIQQSYSRIK